VLDEIQAIARAEKLFFTDHAVRQMLKRDISDEEVVQAILHGKIIEEYPEDKYSPSCLILGNTSPGRPLHVVCSIPPRVRVVTTYQPDPKKWVDYQRRRK
jgi:hypothetical protein